MSAPRTRFPSTRTAARLPPAVLAATAALGLLGCGVQRGQLVDTGNGRLIRLELHRALPTKPRLAAPRGS